MPGTTALRSAPAAHNGLQGAGTVVRIVIGAALLAGLASSVGTALLERVAGAAAGPQRAAPSAVAGTSPHDTDAPDASAVFAGRETPPEEPAPSF
jgi:hypothetical protein